MVWEVHGADGQLLPRKAVAPVTWLLRSWSAFGPVGQDHIRIVALASLSRTMPAPLEPHGLPVHGSAKSTRDESWSSIAQYVWLLGRIVVIHRQLLSPSVVLATHVPLLAQGMVQGEQGVKRQTLLRRHLSFLLDLVWHHVPAHPATTPSG